MSPQEGDTAFPEDAVQVGRVLGAWGVRGSLKVQAFSADPQALLGNTRWFLVPPPEAAPARAVPAFALPLHITDAREHGEHIVATAKGLSNRDEAQALRGCGVFVSRKSFPAAGEGEFYWVDLIGLSVLNRSGLELGRVLGLLDTGAQSVLRVGYGAASFEPASASGVEAGRSAERLIPFVEAYVDGVDFQAGCIRVDWSPDWDV